MRRPDIELTDEAARFVERHPDVIARLASTDGTEATAEIDDARRTRFRAYIRERRAAARSPEADEEARAFLARYAPR